VSLDILSRQLPQNAEPLRKQQMFAIGAARDTHLVQTPVDAFTGLLTEISTSTLIVLDQQTEATEEPFVLKAKWTPIVLQRRNQVKIAIRHVG